MLKRLLLSALSILVILTTGCAAASSPTATPQLVRVYVTPAAWAWLAEAYTCADQLQLILSNVKDPQQADISIRLGEPDQAAAPLYQIGTEDLLVLTNRESALQSMSIADVRQIFTSIDPPAVQVWVFAAGEDVQQVFARDVLGGQRITSHARVALSPQQMSDALNQNQNAIGILPRRWKVGSMREIFSLPNLPVLAQVKPEPEAAIKSLLACLQK